MKGQNTENSRYDNYFTCRKIVEKTEYRNDQLEVCKLWRMYVSWSTVLFCLVVFLWKHTVQKCSEIGF